MKSNMRCNFSGAFTARALRDGAWLLTRDGAHRAEIYISGADFAAPLAFKDAPLLDLGIEWRAGSALITLLAANKVHSVDAQNVIVHQPLPGLYAALPLSVFGPKLRRFWKRVFWLVRIPGGRLLLQWLARSRR